MIKLHNRSGQGLLEYSLLLGLIALACVATLTLLGDEVIETIVTRIQITIDDAMKIIVGGSSESSGGDSTSTDSGSDGGT